MRGRSSNIETKQGMEIDRVKEEPHLSGAYIRSLVKQLTSSRSKDPMNPKDGADGDVAKFDEENHPENRQPPQQPPQQHKKQVRRRLHTSRPYQERLLNMAEARREIVTALKLHRAAMKQANEQQQQQQPQSSVPLHLSPPPCLEQEGKMKSRRNPRIYPSSTATYLDDISYAHSHSPYPFSWPTPPLVQSSPVDNLNFPLPNQTLGLNLNFQDFNDIDTNLYHKSNNPSSFYSSSSSSSPSLSIVTEEFPSVAKGMMMAPAVSESYSGSGLHQVMDDDEMAEIRSLGEQHEMEWNDTMNLVTSAWWFKFMKTMEFGGEVKAEVDGFQPFDEVMEFPAWLNANDGSFIQEHHFNDCCSQDYLHHHSLPCMDIGEIDGMDGEWLS